MLKNKQYNLLKCKLENNENITIDNKSIQVLFGCFEKNINCTETTTILKEILISLLDKKRNEFEICDLSKMAIMYNSLMVINLMINEPYNVPVYPSIIENTIRYSTVQNLEYILELQIKLYGPIVIEDQLKLRSLSVASNNKNHHEEMMKFILSTTDTSSNNKYGQLFRIGYKQVHGNLIDLKLVLSLTCLETKNKLYELNLISNEGFKTNFNSFNLNLPFDQLSFLVKIYCKYITNDQVKLNLFIKETNKINEKYGDGGDGKLKELHKLMIITIQDNLYMPYIYKQYIVKYKETINEIHAQDGTGLISANDNSKYSNFLNLFRFICCGPSYHYDGTIQLIKESMDERNLDKLEWYPIFDQLNHHKDKSMVIQDKKQIDWFVNCKNRLVHSLFFDYIGRMEFKSIDLLEYIHSTSCGLVNIKITLPNKYNTVPILNKEPNYRNYFIQSINQLNFKELDIIFKNCSTATDQNFKFLDNVNSKFIIQLPTAYKSTSSQNLINYLNNSDGFKYFSKELLVILFKELFKTPQLEIKEIKLNFNSFASGTLSQLFEKSVVSLQLDLLELLILNGIDLQLKSFSGSVNTILNSNKSNFIDSHVYNAQSQNGIIQRNLNESCKQQLLSIISILVSRCINNNIKSYENLINYLFKELIAFKNIQPVEINQLFKLFSENSICIKHCIYNSLYYLHIKDIRFTKYILSIPHVGKIYDGPINFYYTEIIEIDLGKYFIANSFSFDYIFSSDNSFEIILNQLVTQLSHGVEDNKRLFKFTNSKLNSNLQYFLEIKRTDLFFGELDFINQQINNLNSPPVYIGNKNKKNNQ